MKMTVERTSHSENGLGLIFNLMFRVFLACSSISTKIQARVLIKLVVIKKRVLFDKQKLFVFGWYILFLKWKRKFGRKRFCRSCTGFYVAFTCQSNKFII